MWLMLIKQRNNSCSIVMRILKCYSFMQKMQKRMFVFFIQVNKWFSEVLSSIKTKFMTFFYKFKNF